MLKRITAAFAGLVLGASALLAPAASASPATPAAPSEPKVCREGSRDHGDYNRLCLTVGTPKTARELWFSVPEGRKGRESDNFMTRRDICRYAKRHGGITVQARELVTDMTFDNYRNYRQVDAWVGQDARLDCAQMGYRV